MEREALNLAIIALGCIEYGPFGINDGPSEDTTELAITAIKEALAQPAQEPHEYDWSMLEAAKESLREHMARIKELEAALAQPAQEPVACVGPWDGPTLTLLPRSIHQTFEHNQLLYAAPPQRPWVGLTDAEIDEGNKQSWVTKQAWESAVWWASEKLKEKNNGT